MENKKQSSIEWFNQQIIDRQNGEGDSRNWDTIFQQAKKKHKQEIINAVEWNYKSNMGEVYYLATYKNQENDKV
jgi:hypothetical protein